MAIINSSKKLLSQLLKNHHSLIPGTDCEITGLNIDSRKVKPGDLFFACPGLKTDGLCYIEQAIANGAAAVVVDAAEDNDKQSILANWIKISPVPIIPLPCLLDYIGPIAAEFYDQPGQHLNVIGITGTNGKTSCSQLIASGLNNLGQACGIIGTLGYGWPNSLAQGSYTTPDAPQLQQLLAEFCSQKASAVTIEVSSHSLDQGRVLGTPFDIAIFTNLTRDHLDYHGSMENYGAAKRRLFTLPNLRHAIINENDEFGRCLLNEFAGSLELISYSLETTSFNLPHSIKKIIAHDIKANYKGISAKVISPWGEGQLKSQLLGRFNLSNLLATLATFCVLGVPFSQALDVIAKLQTVSGRMQTLGGGELPLIIIDYAHTPDALEQALKALRAHCQSTLWCIFGCGGDRDRGKRATMAQIAESYADKLIITDDNPRHENPTNIVEDMLQGLLRVSEVVIEHDRAQAIKYALNYAKKGDVVLIAGKGHESYQQIGDQKYLFSDFIQVNSWLQMVKNKYD